MEVSGTIKSDPGGQSKAQLVLMEPLISSSLL